MREHDYLSTIEDMAALIVSALRNPDASARDLDSLKEMLRSEFSEQILFFHRRSQCGCNGSRCEAPGLIQDAIEKVDEGKQLGGQALRPWVVGHIGDQLAAAVESAPGRKALWSAARRNVVETNALPFQMLAEVGKLGDTGGELIAEALEGVSSRVRIDYVEIGPRQEPYLIEAARAPAEPARPTPAPTGGIEQSKVETTPGASEPVRPTPASTDDDRRRKRWEPPFRLTLKTAGSVLVALSVVITILAFVEVTLYDIIPFLSLCEMWPFSTMQIDRCG